MQYASKQEMTNVSQENCRRYRLTWELVDNIKYYAVWMKAEGLTLHKEWRKAKTLKALECGSTRLAQQLVTKCDDVNSLCTWYVKAAWSILTYSLTGRQPYFFPFYLTLLSSFILLYSLPFLPYFLFLLAWLKLIWIFFPLSSPILLYDNFKLCLSQIPIASHRKYCKTISNCVVTKFKSHLIEKFLRYFQIVSFSNSNRISSKIF